MADGSELYPEANPHDVADGEADADVEEGVLGNVDAATGAAFIRTIPDYEGSSSVEIFLSPAHRIEKAKAMISIKDFKSARARYSKLWEYWKVAELTVKPTETSFEAEIEKLKQYDSEAAQEFWKAPTQAVWICTICFEMKTKTLRSCLKQIPKTGHSSNLQTHLYDVHKHPKTKDASLPSNEYVTPKKRASARIDQFFRRNDCDAGSAITGSILNNALVNAKKPKMTVETAVSRSEMNEVLSVIHKAQVNMSTAGNIPPPFFYARPELKEYTLLVLKHADTLKKVSENQLVAGKHRFHRVRMEQYEYLLAYVTSSVEQARAFYQGIAAKHVPFITFSHDVWDGASREKIGITLFYYDPISKTHKRIPIGMIEVESKTSDYIAKVTMTVMEKFGIKKADLFRSVNDTTKSALKVGDLLTGSKGSCAMHCTELIIEHATGKKTRSKDNKVWDSFKECEDLRKKVQEAAFYLMFKKAKSHFTKYTEMMKNIGRDCVKISMPNNAGSAGYQIFYKSMLISCWNLREYWFRDETAAVKTLSDDDWIAVSEVEAVLYPVTFLNKRLQNNKFGSIAYSFLRIYRCYVEYITKKVWNCADVDKRTNKTSNQWWHAGAKFPLRDYGGKSIDAKEPSMLVVKMKKKKLRDMKPISTKLIQRIEKEFRRYGAKPRDEQLLAMLANPLMATLGFSELNLLAEECRGHADPEVQAMYAKFRDDACKLTHALIKDICSEKLKSPENLTAPPREESTSSDDDERPVDKARNALLQASVWTEIKTFIATEINWVHYLTKEGKPVHVVNEIGVNKCDWMKNWEIIADHFDVMQWWEMIGKQRFPHLYLLACIVLPLPESNGSQEQTCSTTTWLDGMLNNCQSEETFQMKLMLHQNLPLLIGTEQPLKGHFKTRAKEITKSLIKAVEAFRHHQLQDDDKLVVEQVGEEEENDMLETFESEA